MDSCEPIERFPDPEAVERSFDQAPRLAPPDDDGLPPGRPPGDAPATIRAVVWLIYLVHNLTVWGFIRGVWSVCGRRRRRAMVWVLMLYVKVYGFVGAIRGGRIDHAEYEERNETCLRCPHVVTRQRGGSYLTPDPPRHYCGECGCGEWYLARLIGKWGKNWWKRHFCPEERHPQTEYPRFVTISPSGCGTKAFKIPGGRANAQH